MMNATPITLGKCAAIEGDYFMFASKPDELDDSSELTRIFHFDNQAPEDKWRHSDIPYYSTVSLCVITTALGGERRYAALSNNGDLNFASNEGLFFLDYSDEKSRLQKVDEIAECEDISVFGDTLLCIGSKTINILDNNGWSELKHPDIL